MSLKKQLKIKQLKSAEVACFIFAWVGLSTPARTYLATHACSCYRL